MEDIFQKGDKKAFRKVYDEHKKSLFQFIYNIVKDPDVANDIFQETFVKVYKYSDTFKGESTIKTWIFRIASNTALNELKRIQRSKNREISDYGESLTESHSNHDDRDTKELLNIAIQTSMKVLTPTQLMVFKLRHINGLSTKEAADSMNCSTSNVKKQLFLAVNRIRDHIKKKYPDLTMII